MDYSDDSSDTDSLSSELALTQNVGNVEKQTGQASNNSVIRKKNQRHRQAYRVEWESQPDFKGWLKGVPGEPTRAYCLYCDRTLHAHCLSLLKHMCTLKHTKAAQMAYAKQMMKEHKVLETTSMESQQHLLNSEETEVERASQQINSSKGVSVGRNILSLDGTIVTPQEQIVNTEMSSPQSHKKGMSTHVLDTAKGKPADGLPVSLYKLIGGKWTIVSEGFTDTNGRYCDFLQNGELSTGRYKLHFDVDRYFEVMRQESLYPFIEIVFDVKSPQEHYHIPLLLSPFGYSTYRGS